MNGLVIKSTGSWYGVLMTDGRKILCRMKGRFRLSNIKTTNPIAVGDQVEVELELGQDTGLIVTIQPRKNYLIRKSVNLSKQAQIIAANLDQAFLIVTLASPRTSLGFIDRFLVTAEAYDIPVMLIFNKLDLYEKTDLDTLKRWQSIYRKIGYDCFSMSAIQGTHINQIKELLKDKTTLIAGHSGVGKSTLINVLSPTSLLKTGHISNWSDRGKHTTTFAEMISLSFGGYLVDTPGIRELGIIDINQQELGHFFPEMRQCLPQCKFYNCRHINEPGCAVLAAVEQGQIAQSRYENYLSIYHGNETRK